MTDGTKRFHDHIACRGLPLGVDRATITGREVGSLWMNPDTTARHSTCGGRERWSRAVPSGVLQASACGAGQLQGHPSAFRSGFGFFANVHVYEESGGSRPRLPFPLPSKGSQNSKSLHARTHAGESWSPIVQPAFVRLRHPRHFIFYHNGVTPPNEEMVISPLLPLPVPSRPVPAPDGRDGTMDRSPHFIATSGEKRKGQAVISSTDASATSGVRRLKGSEGDGYTALHGSADAAIGQEGHVVPSPTRCWTVAVISRVHVHVCRVEWSSGLSLERRIVRPILGVIRTSVSETTNE